MLDVSRPLFAYARCHRVKNEAYLREQAEHGKRTGPTAAIRPGGQPAQSLFWSRDGRETGEYVEDLRSHLREAGARTRGGAAISLHLLLGVSAEWLQETGGIHDGCNSRVKKLFEEVKAFAEAHITGVYAMRMDLDERGSGVVDVFAAPVHMRRGRPKKDGTRGQDVCEVSVKEALVGMQRTAGGGKQFAALQTLWAHHAAHSLDSRIVRGVPKKITGREHLSVSEYRESVEAEKVWREERHGQRQTILNSFLLISQKTDEIEAAETQLDERKQALDELQPRLDAERASLAKRVAEADVRERVLEGRERSLEGLRTQIIEDAVKKEAQRAVEHAAAQLRLQQAELAARAATEQAAAERRRIAARMAEADEREEQFEARARKQQRADEDSALKAREVERRSAQLAFEADRLGTSITTTKQEAELVRLRAEDLVRRERAHDETVRVHRNIEAARSAAHDDKLAKLQDVERAVERREADATARERDAHQLRLSASRSAAVIAAERDTLRRERVLLNDQGSKVQNEAAALEARKATLSDRERVIAKREKAHSAAVSALEAGVTDIAEGRINKVTDIVMRPELGPAADLLTKVVRAIGARVKPMKIELERRREALVSAQEKVAAAIATAVERETAAKQVEEKYKAATKAFVPGLKRLQRIRGWASVIVKYADNPTLRRINSALSDALDGLVREFDVDSRNTPGRE